MKVEFAILALVLSSWQASAPHQPDFSFTIQTEKQIFKPGEPIVVLALLRNQSASDIYVPHAMTPCSGGASHIEFSLIVVKGKEPTSGSAGAVLAAVAATAHRHPRSLNT